MANSNNYKKVVPAAKDAGKIGGQMVRKMIQQAEDNMTK